MRGYKTKSHKSARVEQNDHCIRIHSRCSRRATVSLDATSAGIGLFCRLMPSASASAWPCTATRARCFGMSTPSKARDPSSNHRNWAHSWISPCATTSETNPNSKSQRERTTGLARHEDGQLTSSAHFERPPRIERRHATVLQLPRR